MNTKKTILIVDDSQLIREILNDLLKDEYEILKACNGDEAIACLEEHAELLSVVLLDLIMPKKDGFQVLSIMKEKKWLHTIPVIVITAEDSEKYVTAAYDLGVSEVIHKPFNKNIIRKRVKNLIDLYSHKNILENVVANQIEILKQQAKKLEESRDVMVDALSAIIEYRSLESGQHTKRIRGLTKVLLEQIANHTEDHPLTPQDIEMISSASAMHDIGKIAIPDSILLKPGKLTAEEFEIMKTHTVKGYEILFRFSGLDNKQYLTYCQEICLYHHERWDGNGYPDGLVGDQIPLTAQVVSIADVYDALTHKRIYKPAYSLHDAAEMIVSGKCGIFSPKLLEHFLQILPQWKQIVKSQRDTDF